VRNLLKHCLFVTSLVTVN